VTAALWYVAGRRPIETHSAAAPLACRGGARRRAGGAGATAALRGLTGAEELPAAAAAAAGEAADAACE
jgi:hypothetical protein